MDVRNIRYSNKSERVVLWIFFDLIFWGWYQMLDKTIYSNNNDGSIGPKQHSFFISFLLHGINVWSIFRYMSIEYMGQRLGLYSGLSLAVTVFIIGYFLFIRNKRANAVI